MWFLIISIICAFIPFVFNWEVALLVAILYVIYKPRRWDWARTWPIWKWLREDHMEIEFKGDTSLLFSQEKGQFVFAFYPHGTHCISAILLSTMSELTHVRVACAPILFWTPFINLFIGWANAVHASRDKMRKALRNGSSVIVFPGGFSEVPNATFLRSEEYALEAGDDESKYVYKRRDGFIKVAQMEKVPIVPVWVEGEYDTYKTYFPIKPLSRFCYRWLKYPFIMCSFGWWGSFVPKPGKLIIHIGTPQPTLLEGSTEKIKEKHYKMLDLLKE